MAISSWYSVITDAFKQCAQPLLIHTVEHENNFDPLEHNNNNEQPAAKIQQWYDYDIRIPSTTPKKRRFTSTDWSALKHRSEQNIPKFSGGPATSRDPRLYGNLIDREVTMPYFSYTPRQQRLFNSLDLPLNIAEKASVPEGLNSICLKGIQHSFERRALLREMFRNFVVELTRGTYFTHLDIQRRYVPIHCQLLESLDILTIDTNNGRRIEFPLSELRKIYILVKNSQKSEYDDDDNDEASSITQLFFKQDYLVVVPFRLRKIVFVFRDELEAERFRLCLEILQHYVQPPPKVPPRNCRFPGTGLSFFPFLQISDQSIYPDEKIMSSQKPTFDDNDHNQNSLTSPERSISLSPSSCNCPPQALNKTKTPGHQNDVSPPWLNPCTFITPWQQQNDRNNDNGSSTVTSCVVTPSTAPLLSSIQTANYHHPSHSSRNNNIFSIPPTSPVETSITTPMLLPATTTTNLEAFATSSTLSPYIQTPEGNKFLSNPTMVPSMLVHQNNNNDNDDDDSDASAELSVALAQALSKVQEQFMFQKQQNSQYVDVAALSSIIATAILDEIEKQFSPHGLKHKSTSEPHYNNYKDILSPTVQTPITTSNAFSKELNARENSSQQCKSETIKESVSFRNEVPTFIEDNLNFNDFPPPNNENSIMTFLNFTTLTPSSNDELV